MLHSQYVENCTKICLQSVIVEWRNSLSVQSTQFCFLPFLLCCICVDKINIHSFSPVQVFNSRKTVGIFRIGIGVIPIYVHSHSFSFPSWSFIPIPTVFPFPVVISSTHVTYTILPSLFHIIVLIDERV